MSSESSEKQEDSGTKQDEPSPPKGCGAGCLFVFAILFALAGLISEGYQSAEAERRLYEQIYGVSP